DLPTASAGGHRADHLEQNGRSVNVFRPKASEQAAFVRSQPQHHSSPDRNGTAGQTRNTPSVISNFRGQSVDSGPNQPLPSSIVNQPARSGITRNSGFNPNPVRTLPLTSQTPTPSATAQNPNVSPIRPGVPSRNLAERQDNFSPLRNLPSVTGATRQNIRSGNREGAPQIPSPSPVQNIPSRTDLTSNSRTRFSDPNSSRLNPPPNRRETRSQLPPANEFAPSSAADPSPRRSSGPVLSSPRASSENQIQRSAPPQNTSRQNSSPPPAATPQGRADRGNRNH
ncbi:MAG: hypothetical protein ABJC04_09820, partial [Verrucomicrobiota bacterium]